MYGVVVVSLSMVNDCKRSTGRDGMAPTSTYVVDPEGPPGQLHAGGHGRCGGDGPASPRSWLSKGGGDSCGGRRSATRRGAIETREGVVCPLSELGLRCVRRRPAVQHARIVTDRSASRGTCVKGAHA